MIHDICFCAEIKQEYFLIEKKKKFLSGDMKNPRDTKNPNQEKIINEF